MTKKREGRKGGREGRIGNGDLHVGLFFFFLDKTVIADVRDENLRKLVSTEEIFLADFNFHAVF